MTPEPPKLPKPQNKTSDVERLIVLNGEIVESLLTHQGWPIIEDLIDEGIASVVGRKTNGYYYSGDLNRSTKSKDYLTGYQEALSQLYNRIKDFVIIKDNMLEKKKQNEADKTQPLINPFMESLDEENE